MIVVEVEEELVKPVQMAKEMFSAEAATVLLLR